MCPTQDGVILMNRSVAGTLLNGVLVQQQSPTSNGDVVAIPFHGNPLRSPIVQFRLECASSVRADAAPRLLGSVGSVGHDSSALSSPPKAVKEAAKEAADVVKVAVDALPPPFSLECVAARGSEGRDLEQLPNAARVLAASFAQAEISVGSSFQSAEFWEPLLKEPSLRTKILPLHFKLSMAHLSDGPMLILDASPDGAAVVFFS